MTREPGAFRRGRLVRAWREGRAGPLRFVLTPLAWAYRGGLAVRELAYRRGWLVRGRLPCPVVSLGNLTVGGTGKTPAVEMVARWLTDEGRRVVIVSRGYGRRPGAPVELVSDGGAPRLPAERAGDEPLLLARRLPGVAVVVGADRLRAGQWAVANLRPDVVLLDDGFQQRRLVKDVEIVCLDARAPWGPGGLFPRGTLREPRSALTRADLIIVTRADARRNLAGLFGEIRHHAGLGALPGCGLRGRGPRGPGIGRASSRRRLSRVAAVLAFAGIAAPERLSETLTAHGANVRDVVAFPDHHAYRPSDLDAVRRRARAMGASLLVTTEKDAVRLRPPGTTGAWAPSGQAGEALVPIWVLRVRLEPAGGPSLEGWRAELRARVDAAARGAARP